MFLILLGTVRVRASDASLGLLGDGLIILADVRIPVEVIGRILEVSVLADLVTRDIAQRDCTAKHSARLIGLLRVNELLIDDLGRHRTLTLDHERNDGLDDKGITLLRFLVGALIDLVERDVPLVQALRERFPLVLTENLHEGIDHGLGIEDSGEDGLASDGLGHIDPFRFVLWTPLVLERFCVGSRLRVLL